MQMQYDLTEILNRYQFGLKRNIKSFLFTKVNVIWSLFCLIFSNNNSLTNSLVVYVFGMLILYRYAFFQTRNSNPYKIFLINYAHNLLLAIRKNLKVKREKK